jgi:hypothetical protein
MEQTECSETSKIQTQGNYPKESIQHTEHSESLKSRIFPFSWILKFAVQVCAFREYDSLSNWNFVTLRKYANPFDLHLTKLFNHVKALFIFHNDAHNYKITGILKQQVGMLPWHWRRHKRRGYRTTTVVLAKHKNGSLMMVPAWTETCRSERRNFNCFNIPVIL